MNNRLYKNLPEDPGVYIMKGIPRTRAANTVRGKRGKPASSAGRPVSPAGRPVSSAGRVLYIGKAANLRRRVSSYFSKAHNSRVQKMVREIKRIDYEKTDTTLEALILEAELIKKYQPPYNIREKDDKSFLYVEITKDEFPRILLVRGKNKATGRRYGPFTSASNIREALRTIRRIFPFSVHFPERLGEFKRPCFDYQIGLCPGTCIDAVSRSEYLKNIKHIKLLFKGEKKMILKNLEKDMRDASKKLEFERAEKLRRQIFALKHIQDVALITSLDGQVSDVRGQRLYRIEGYDVSNISGTSAVGSMVVFKSGKPDKNEYRKFRIRTITKSDDVGMLKEILHRRFGNSWPLPDLILIDGGKGQVNAAKGVLSEFGLKIPIVGIAKGPKRKRNDVIGIVPQDISVDLLIRVRNEAHRFAHTYHKKVRGGVFLSDIMKK